MVNSKQGPGKKTPAGWDSVTYANFKKANPNLEPNAEDTARMQAADGMSIPKTPKSMPINSPTTMPAGPSKPKADRLEWLRSFVDGLGKVKKGIGNEVKGTLKNIANPANVEMWNNLKKIPAQLKSDVKKLGGTSKQ